METFYDTCSLLHELQNAFHNHFYISILTLKELEDIKTSAFKDSDVKFRARRLIHLLDENEDKYTMIKYNNEWNQLIENNDILSNNNDSKIIITALMLQKAKKEIIFKTKDLCCKNIAKALGLKVEYISDENKENYTGFKEISLSNEELAKFYEQKSTIEKENLFDLLINQYLIIKDKSNQIIDKYKYSINKTLDPISFYSTESRMFGKIKPKDVYQQLAIDSMKTNKITMVRGAAGTGKSYLSFGVLFEKLEKNEIEKIIIFCNTVATSGSAKLGYYPGSRDEKLLDSQIGNLLASKIGDKVEVTRLIDEGKIILLPMSDIRGYDTTGMKAGVYITEAQNLDIELMRLALQRIGEDSICILDGDSDAQVDLSIYAGNNNGMRRVSEIFKGDSIYGEITLQNIHRSHIAQLAQLM